MKNLAPDVVLDMIPLGEEDTRAVVRVFTSVARRIVAISSQDVFRAYGRLHETEIGPPEETPLTEEAPLRERFFPYRDAATDTDDPRYRYEKILVEREIMGNSDLPGTVLRLPAVYGRRDPQHRLFPYLKRMDDKRPGIILDEVLARWRWSRIYVENAASAITLAVTDDRAAGRVYNIAEPEALTEAEWIRQIGLAAGWSGEVVIVPEDHLPTHLQRKWDARQHSVADSTRIRHEMGYREHVPLSEGLHRTIAWERAHPPDQANWPKFDYAVEDEALSRTSL